MDADNLTCPHHDAILVDEEKPAGTYELTWYAENLPSGIYFYQLKTEGYVETKKMVLMK